MAAATPDLDAALEDRAIGALGIHIVKTFMDEVRYERVDGKNCMIVKKRTAAPAGDAG